MIMSRERVNDGQEHTIEVSKLGRTGSLKIDGENEVSGESQGFLQMLNADGNVYIGMLKIYFKFTKVWMIRTPDRSAKVRLHPFQWAVL